MNPIGRRSFVQMVTAGMALGLSGCGNKDHVQPLKDLFHVSEIASRAKGGPSGHSSTSVDMQSYFRRYYISKYLRKFEKGFVRDDEIDGETPASIIKELYKECIGNPDNNPIMVNKVDQVVNAIDKLIESDTEISTEFSRWIISNPKESKGLSGVIKSYLKEKHKIEIQVKEPDSLGL